MTDPRYYYEPARGHGLPHDPFNAIVGPRPIGWISTRAANGRSNLAPYSYFNAVSRMPPMIVFSSNTRKDTLNNIEETGEFGWNLASRPLAEQMNLCSAPAPPEISEFALTGLPEEKARLINAPLVATSPVSFECVKSEIIRLRDRHGHDLDNWLVVGEVIAIHIAPQFLTDGIYDTAAAQPILRGGGTADYFAIKPDDYFRMKRPQWPAKE